MRVARPKRKLVWTSAVIAVGVVAAAACADAYDTEVDVSRDASSEDAAATLDATTLDGGSPDAGSRCAHDARFGEAEVVTGLAGGGDALGARLTSTGLAIFSGRPDPPKIERDLWVAYRADASSPFGTPVKLVELSSDLDEGKPSLPRSLARLYFHRADGPTDYVVMVATRQPGGTLYLEPVPLEGGVNTPGLVQDPFVTEDERELYVAVRDRYPDGGIAADAFLRRVTGPGDGTFGQPSPVIVDGAPARGSMPVLSVDGLALYFSAPVASASDTAIYVATRSSTSETFSGARRIEELDFPDMRDEPSYLTEDACTLYFFSNRNARFEVFRATRAR